MQIVHLSDSRVLSLKQHLIRVQTRLSQSPLARATVSIPALAASIRVRASGLNLWLIVIASAGRSRAKMVAL